MTGEERRFIRIAVNMFGGERQFSTGIVSERFLSLFGVTLSVATIIWGKLEGKLETESKTEHLLWSLLRLRTYATGDVCATIVNVDSKTFRKWSRRFIEKLAGLCMVCMKQT